MSRTLRLAIMLTVVVAAGLCVLLVGRLGELRQPASAKVESMRLRWQEVRPVRYRMLVRLSPDKFVDLVVAGPAVERFTYISDGTRQTESDRDASMAGRYTADAVLTAVGEVLQCVEDGQFEGPVRFGVKFDSQWCFVRKASFLVKHGDVWDTEGDFGDFEVLYFKPLATAGGAQ